ncbi:AcsA protein [Salmonella enterica subsp. enterica serovar Abony]|nr:AcsA protein [Salmonella enterica subsp. enterica serovar Abony]EDH1237465.1 AcsA protein [Salmonella enterica subsp. enterica]HBD1790904.1 AcsA protein [Salmonella enterica]EBY6401031.1 AcsA protein [Salmonella enterica subsp. enterica serovar Abony]EHK4823456.1 AcsA protein [Salmonella enterica subsp. enterica serovar Abony]
MTVQSMAAGKVMQDLVDCLLAENFFGEPLTPLLPSDFRDDKRTPPFRDLHKDECTWLWSDIAIALRPGITQSLEKVPGTPVLAWQENKGRWEPLEPQAFMTRAFDASKEFRDPEDPGRILFMEALETSLRQTALSLAHSVETEGLMERDNAGFFLMMERWASLRDRPYHPLAKAKQGLSDKEYQAFQAEFARPVRLDWVAVEKSLLLCGEGVGDLQRHYPARYLLPDTWEEELALEMRHKGIADTHVALPVHPWQREHIIETRFDEWFSRGACCWLDFSHAEVFATSSLRSMTPCFSSSDYLKLPMAVYSLSSSRYLPAVKMINGGLSEALLRQGRELDTVLQHRLYLCDEQSWWAFMPPEASLFDESPRHLSAQVRRYPDELLQDAAYRLMPMAALGTPLPGSRRHFFDDWLRVRGLEPEPGTVLTLFSELCHCFFDVNLRMFRLGMVGEVHGQNAVLVWRAGQAAGLLLRDHDSLRIYVPWLERHGLSDPRWRLKAGHPNTLYHQRPEDLLFWLQTLAIQVNMRAIIDTLAECYTLREETLWQAMRDELDQLINDIDFDEHVRSMLRHHLFDATYWPQKLLLTPMIERAGAPGSMPFGKGEVVNPFLRLTNKSDL